MSCKVFVVGSSGYIGEGVALAFRRNGYKVFGLIRDEKKSKNLLRNEIIPIIGYERSSFLFFFFAFHSFEIMVLT